MPKEQLAEPTRNVLSEKHIGEAISDIAEVRGIVLEPKRLTQLLGWAKKRQENRAAGAVQFEDAVNNISIQSMQGNNGLTVVNVDFAPILDDDSEIVSGITAADPGHATEIILRGLRGMQNYALLVEAGLIERPDILYAKTNPIMAITAERMGMRSDIARQHDGDSRAAHAEMQRHDKLEISGTFEEVSEHLFSAGAQRLERVLVRRQAAQPVGQTALR